MRGDGADEGWWRRGWWRGDGLGEDGCAGEDQDQGCGQALGIGHEAPLGTDILYIAEEMLG